MSGKHANAHRRQLRVIRKGVQNAADANVNPFLGGGICFNSESPLMQQLVNLLLTRRCRVQKIINKILQKYNSYA